MYIKYDVYMPPSDQCVKVIQKPLCQDSTKRVPVRTFIQKVLAELKSQKQFKSVFLHLISFSPFRIHLSTFQVMNLSCEILKHSQV